jgi:predicted transcriptional regulator
MIIDMALVTVSEQRRVVEPKLVEASRDRFDEQVQITVGYRVEERDLLKALGDECTRTILLSMIDEPKSAIDITREKKIPISSVYRKIHWLENARLIKVKGFVITGDGKKYHLYQSGIRTIQVTLSRGEVNVSFTDNSSIKHDVPTPEQKIPIE